MKFLKHILYIYRDSNVQNITVDKGHFYNYLLIFKKEQIHNTDTSLRARDPALKGSTIY